MKILYMGYNMHLPRGGGKFSDLTLLDKLKSGHDVTILNITDATGKGIDFDEIDLVKAQSLPLWTKKSLPAFARKLLFNICAQREMQKIVRSKAPDLLFVQEYLAMAGLTTSTSNAIPSILFLRGQGWRYPPFDMPLLHRLYNEPFGKFFGWRIKPLLKQATVVCANSTFTARLYEDYIGRRAEVVYPFIDLSKYQANKDQRDCSERKFITHINPSKGKGILITLELARRLPSREFQVVGETNDKEILNMLMAQPNINYLGWRNDLTEVFAKTRLLLMPVIWTEPFGRVPIEAGINGIPTIASNRGGLPESVGEGGILINNVQEIDAWLEAIKLLDDPQEYESYSRKAFEHARRFDFQNTFNTFQTIVERDLKVEL